MRAKPVWQQVDPTTTLCAFVSAYLRSQNHSDPEGWAVSLPPAAQFGSFEEQREGVNRALRIWIGRCPEQTLHVRDCITDTGTREDWLRLFTSEVGPWLMWKDRQKATA